MTSHLPFHIAVFCKAPVAGRVKTRLIPQFGAGGAAAIYLQLALHALQTVNDAREQYATTASLWVADDTEHPAIRQWSRDFNLPVFLQQGEDLGARMLHCLQSLAADRQRVLLIGTDCPALTAGDLASAAATLDAGNRWVFTPAEDGGYVLVGSNAPNAVPFSDVAWSTDAVMAQTRAALAAANERWAEMPRLWDVDEPADVGRAVALGLIRV